jgi:hypothetical protein
VLLSHPKCREIGEKKQGMPQYKGTKTEFVDRPSNYYTTSKAMERENWEIAAPKWDQEQREMIKDGKNTNCFELPFANSTVC